MSKPRYRWWGYVKAVVRDYPRLADKYRDLHSPQITVQLTGSTHGSGAARTTESLAIRSLPATEQREYEAVRLAIEVVSQTPDAECRFALLRRVFWGKTHTLYGAAMSIPISYGTAKNWHNSFIRQVGKNLGLMDREDAHG